MTPQQFQHSILTWYDQKGRKNLPWQQDITPYSVWVSEIMLQQTQVGTVIPFYQRFMQRFPDVETLARAPLDEVLHLWTGLGYYARARNLHRSAQCVVQDHESLFPNDLTALMTLPGIGRSTAGAIRSIAFNQPAAILDGNVKRVLARYAAIDGWPGKNETLKKLWAIAEQLAPKERTAQYSQALMDLGATLCTPNPNCPACPIAGACRALAQDNPHAYPGKKPKKNNPVRHTYFLVISKPTGELLLQKNPPEGLWGGLWIFPQCDDMNAVETFCERHGICIASRQVLPQRRHTFSHFHLDYQPIRIALKTDTNHAICTSNDRYWYNHQSPRPLGMPAPVVELIKAATHAL